MCPKFISDIFQYVTMKERNKHNGDENFSFPVLRECLFIRLTPIRRPDSIRDGSPSEPIATQSPDRPRTAVVQKAISVSCFHWARSPRKDGPDSVSRVAPVAVGAQSPSSPGRSGDVRDLGHESGVEKGHSDPHDAREESPEKHVLMHSQS